MMNTRDDEHEALERERERGREGGGRGQVERVRAVKRAFMPGNQASKSKRRRDTTPLSPRLD